MDPGGGSLPVGDGVDEVARTERHVARRPDALVGRAQRRPVDHQLAPRRARQLDPLVEKGPVGGLAHGEDDRVGSQHLLGPGHEGRGETTLLVEHGCHTDRLQPAHPSVAHHAVRPAAVDDPDALCLRIGDLLGRRRDLLGRLQRHDRDLAHTGPHRGAGRVERRGGTATGILGRLDAQLDRRGSRLAAGAGPQAGAGGVERDVATTHHDHALAQLDPEALVHVQQNLDGTEHTVEVVAGDVEVATTARAHRQQHCGVPLDELGQGNVGAHPAPGSRLHAQLQDRLDLPGDERPRQPVLGDAQHHHPPEPVLRVIDRHRVAGEAQVMCCAQARRPATDDPHGRQRRRWHWSVSLVPERVRGEALDAELFGHEPLQGPDGDRRVHLAPAAGGLTRRRAHPPADRRKRVGPPCNEVGVAVAPLRDGSHIAPGVGVDRACSATGFVLPQPPRVGHPR